MESVGRRGGPGVCHVVFNMVCGAADVHSSRKTKGEKERIGEMEPDEAGHARGVVRGPEIKSAVWRTHPASRVRGYGIEARADERDEKRTEEPYYR